MTKKEPLTPVEALRIAHMYFMAPRHMGDYEQRYYSLAALLSRVPDWLIYTDVDQDECCEDCYRVFPDCLCRPRRGDES